MLGRVSCATLRFAKSILFAIYSSPVEGPASFVNVAVGGTNKFTLNFTSITVHPGYVPATYANNLAFLKLTVPAKVDGSKLKTL